MLMNIISTNTLTKDQYEEIGKLTSDCQKIDNTAGLIFLESDMNEYERFPCFHLLYEDKKLSSFLSIFIPNTNECEVYAFTTPKSRNKGLFKKLFFIAKEFIDEYGIKDILLVSEPNNNLYEQLFKTISAKFYYSDFMMKYNTDYIPKPENNLKLKVFQKNHIEIFETYLNDEHIGGCRVDNSSGSSTIYDFEIIEKMRNKGYGRETLLLVLDYLLNNHHKNIILHIDGRNITAHSMYLKYGFENVKQIDYWKVI